MSKFSIKLENGASLIVGIPCGVCGEDCNKLGVWVHKSFPDDYACAHCALNERNCDKYDKIVSISLVD